MNKLFLAPLLMLGCAIAAPKKDSGLAEGISHHSDIFYTGMKKGVTGYRIPALITAKNGDLVAAIDERVPNLSDLNKSRDINIAVRRSNNGGRTWTKAKIVVDFPLGQSASDPSFVLDEKTGHIFMFYNFMDLDKEKDVYYLHYVVSKNNGKSWSKPVDITEQIAKPEWKRNFKFITSGRGIYTSDGKILHNIVNLQRGLYIFGSDDHGKSWYVIDNPIKPADESKLVELNDGTWMINSRVNGAGRRHVHRSTDQGKTWTSAAEPTLVDPSCNGSIIRYTSTKTGHDKDRLLFSNANSPKGRKNLTVRISYDEGQTWSEGKVVYPGSSAYSSLSVLKDGKIAVFFEKDNHQSNEVVVFTLDWLTDGKDKYVAPVKQTPEARGKRKTTKK